MSEFADACPMGGVFLDLLPDGRAPKFCPECGRAFELTNDRSRWPDHARPQAERLWAVLRRDGPVQWWSNKFGGWYDFEHATLFSDEDKEAFTVEVIGGKYVEVPYAHEEPNL